MFPFDLLRVALALLVRIRIDMTRVRTRKSPYNSV